jgi:integrase
MTPKATGLTGGGRQPEELRPVLTFAYNTGRRKGEILALQWTQVDLKERVVRLELGKTKNDEGRTIPLTSDLFEDLAMQKAIRDQSWPKCPWVFHRYGEQIKNFRGSWKNASKKAGLWTGDEKTGRPTKLFHDLRRTGVRNLVRAGVSETVAMRISGHKTRSIFDRYNITSEKDLKDAARRLGEYLASKQVPARSEETGFTSH